jgi:hypothetical protein
MKTPDDTEFLESGERSLDKGMAQRRQVRFRLPLLDLDVLSIEDQIVVASFERYGQVARAPQDGMEQDNPGASIPDAPLSPRVADDLDETEQT